MGSGISGNYNNTVQKSQDYAKIYSVTDDMLTKDIKDGIYNKTSGYFKNPTSTLIDDAYEKDGKFHIKGKEVENKKYIYVVDEKGNFYFGDRSNPIDPNGRSPHPTLIGGKNPKIQIAGLITFKNGKIYDVDNQSGHFKPNVKSLAKAEDILFNKFGNVAFHKNSRLRRNNND